ncbi:hypothetical protein [Flavobacterium sp. CS20]|uniref:hypothetical protein n=1 Tax=Flavobacterium sp. CS20 TaxID=2775246 RepID=UPI001B39FC3D|nr:hypothetical protein [Flavobacterium sp. CS20]QTY27302.1 hypothetical protein IGB25_01595 [Flavobacterium sp. CS20]
MIFVATYFYYKINENSKLKRDERKIDVFKQDIKKNCIRIKVNSDQCTFKTVKNTEIKPSSYLTDIQFFNYLSKSKNDISLKTTEHTQILYKHKSIYLKKNFYSKFMNIDKITLQALLYNKSFYIYYNEKLKGISKNQISLKNIKNNYFI